MMHKQNPLASARAEEPLTPDEFSALTQLVMHGGTASLEVFALIYSPFAETTFLALKGMITRGTNSEVTVTEKGLKAVSDGT